MLCLLWIQVYGRCVNIFCSFLFFFQCFFLFSILSPRSKVREQDSPASSICTQQLFHRLITMTESGAESGAESGVPWPEGTDFTMLPELFIDTREATFADVGPMATIFLKALGEDATAQLLFPRDESWPIVVEMLRNYLDDEYTQVLVAYDEYTDTIVGWTSVSLVTSDQDDYFKYCDSSVWVGRQLLRQRAQASGRRPLHVDDMKRAAFITKLREKNRNGQNRYANEAGGHRLVINTVAIHPEAVEEEIPQIAYKLIDDARDIAKEGMYLFCVGSKRNFLLKASAKQLCFYFEKAR